MGEQFRPVICLFSDQNLMNASAMFARASGAWVHIGKCAKLHLVLAVHPPHNSPSLDKPYNLPLEVVDCPAKGGCHAVETYCLKRFKVQYYGDISNKPR